MSNLTANPTTETFIRYKGQTSIQDSAFGYYPSLPINGFLLSLFTALIKYKTWAFTLGTSFGYVVEILAYVFRLFLIENPWSTTCIILQNVLFNFGPALLDLGIYVISDEAVRTFDPNYSHWYPLYYLFVVVEYFSVVLQAIGVVFAFYENKVSPQLDLGSFLVFFATVMQLVALGSFATMMVALAVRYFIILPNKPGSEEETFDDDQPPLSLRSAIFDRSTLFPSAVTTAFLAFLTRYICRVVLTKGGWGGSLMQNQNAFIACDSVMCATAALFLTVFHPEYCWPKMRHTVGFWKTCRAGRLGMSEDTGSAASSVDDLEDGGRRDAADVSVAARDVDLEKGRDMKQEDTHLQ